MPIVIRKHPDPGSTCGGQDSQSITHLNTIEQFRYFFVAHADATVAGGNTQQVLTVGSMNINAALQSVGIIIIQPVQTQNSS